MSSSADSHPSTSHQSRFRGVDGITQDERDAPPGSDAAIAHEQSLARQHQSTQPQLFDLDTRARPPSIAEIPPLHASASLPLARTWFHKDLERKRRPENTIRSYSYDLMVLEQLIGQKPVDEITGQDVARYLGDASNKSTRKRRLTSIRRFFDFLLAERVLTSNPADGYFPHHIELRLPVPLFPDEQERIVATAVADEPWSALAIWLMLRLGLTRSELLALRRDHIDRTNQDRPVIYIYYAETTKRSKERALVADRHFNALYGAYLERTGVEDVLVPVGPPAVNGMVERVRKAAGITKAVTPQVLRHTYAVELAREGADQVRLLKVLGLSDDPRNRESVERYIRLARPVNDDGIDEQISE